MFGTVKRKALIWSVISSSIIFTSCDVDSDDLHSVVLEPSKSISGETQGTTYQVIIVDEDVQVGKEDIDSVLHAFDQSLSTYVEDSKISQLNNGSGRIQVQDPTGFFRRCYKISSEVYSKTEGRFDPSVYPLVEGWGFMNDMETPLSQQGVDSLLVYVGFEKGKHHTITFGKNENILLDKFTPEFKLDFNAVAQGLSVDVLCDYLKSLNHEHFYVEIGGEIRVSGKNRDEVDWRIGIDSPIQNETTRTIENVVQISDRAIATSGNYRKFYIIDGVKYSHTINPITGFPVSHSLLSASVIADDCADADAYATAFMVMGVEQTIKFVEANPDLNLEVYLLYEDENGSLSRKMTDGFSQYLD
jgi:thiamine biosynthesis lipoprotein